jgi:hypothetical protein
MSAYTYYGIDESSAIDLGDVQTIKPQNVTYGEAVFKNFNLREVFIDGKSKGEFYVKLWNNNSKVHYNASLFLANRLDTCEVGLIDPGNNLKLEYQIYIKTSDELMKEAMIAIMTDIDRYITKNSEITIKEA